VPALHFTALFGVKERENGAKKTTATAF